VNVERVPLPNGTVADLEIISIRRAAAVVAIDAAIASACCGQFRHAADGWVWELPAGKIDNREPPLDTARRELEKKPASRRARGSPSGIT
jgi:ADP-ribose pyrophosphatase